MTPKGANGTDLIRRPKGSAQQPTSVEVLKPLAVLDVGLLAKDVLDVMRVHQPDLEFSFVQDLKKRNSVTPVDSMATLRIWHYCSPSAAFSRSTVNVLKQRTGSGSRSGGTLRRSVLRRC